MPSRITALTAARQRFEGAGLPLPPVPADLAPELHVQSEWVFSTRQDTVRPYNLKWYVDEYLSGAVPADYLVFGHDGTGINSYAIHYLLVRGPLATFDQIAWGGPYIDNEAAIEQMKTIWVQTGDMIAALEEARSLELIRPDERFILVLSDFHGSRWIRHAGTPTEPLPWRYARTPLMALLDAVVEAQEIVKNRS
jgi:hypothetical protein